MALCSLLPFCPSVRLPFARKLPAGGHCLERLCPLQCLRCLKCQAAPKVEGGRIHQVEPRSPPPRAAKCQRGLSAAGVFGFSGVTFSFDRSRWEWGRGGPRRGRGGGRVWAHGAPRWVETQTHHHTTGRSSRLESGRADGTPDPIALLRVTTVPWHLILESLSLASLRRGEERGGMKF